MSPEQAFRVILRKVGCQADESEGGYREHRVKGYEVGGERDQDIVLIGDDVSTLSAHTKLGDFPATDQHKDGMS